MAAVAAISFVAVLVASETYQRDLDEEEPAGRRVAESRGPATG